jgi:hypothetical protein
VKLSGNLQSTARGVLVFVGVGVDVGVEVGVIDGEGVGDETAANATDVSGVCESTSVSLGIISSKVGTAVNVAGSTIPACSRLRELIIPETPKPIAIKTIGIRMTPSTIANIRRFPSIPFIPFSKAAPQPVEKAVRVSFGVNPR